ncbi:MAG: DUF4264 family protein [Bacillota bacterium]|nr:DUF4264 family protein [Bacillota bacterium]
MSHEEVPASPPRAADEARIELLGQVTLAVSGETHRLVTFLNQTLKDQNLIFGLTRAADGGATFAVYRVTGGK